ncbi:pentatricopeptide repeat-containing protein At1g06140, mitochondrial-like [Humulus lupulus]|uniref:pentatricopeptide repeat-containing protein At1g06140, mitochondrial-like n=1 Tax=Humulus lupulus TaxID=3486 RepID=UPI002B4022C4|nr:pentatricopeptide repeat-containing protein At1g06140, mitochondrial-like [Humulus lupulus]
MIPLFPPYPKTNSFLYSPSSFFHRYCHYKGSSPDSTPTRFNNLLNDTTQTNNLKHVSQIHAQLITNDIISISFLFNNLLNSYAKCGLINRSLLLLSTAGDDVSKNVVAWTTLVTRIFHSRKPFEALSLFSQMRCSGVVPNQFTFSAALPACGDTEILVNGKQLHCLVWKLGLETHLFVCSALIDMYAKCCDMVSAEKVFDEMPERNVVSWNSMITGFLRNEFYDRGVEFFKEVIRESSVFPNEVSFLNALSACAKIGTVEFGRQVHGVVVKHGLETLSYVRNSLIDMYCKCGGFNNAVELFQIRGDSQSDVVSWNIMVSGFISNNKFEDACNLFWIMRREGLKLDEASYSSALNASACLSTLNQGILIHDQIIKSGFVRNACVLSSLITMYSKCGSLIDAFRVFEETKDRNVICWTAMITAYQQHGYVNQVIESFQEMIGDGMKPNYVTFVTVLSACGHAGLVEEGFAYFDSMTKIYGVNPGHEHYACMVDLLGRAGRLDEAKRFIESMPIKPKPSIWGALLGACKNYDNLEMGKEVAAKLFELEPDNPGNYVLLSNIYRDKGRLEEADQIRRLMGVNGIRKARGCSWIDVKNKILCV